MKELILRNQRGPLPERNPMESPVVSLKREMDQFFNGFFESRGRSGSSNREDLFSSFVPNLNVSEDETTVEISVELPGMNEKDIEVSLEKNLLTIKGEKKVKQQERERAYYHMERRFGSFQRSIRLADDIKLDNIQAAFKDGVLVITLPKAEKEQARVIEVKYS
jgi:HSP20 family protein